MHAHSPDERVLMPAQADATASRLGGRPNLRAYSRLNCVGLSYPTLLIEPGGYATDWAGASAHHSAPLPQYQPIREAMMARSAGMRLPGAEATVAALLSIVDAPEPPARILLGSFAQEMAVHSLEQRISGWKRWESVARSADGATE